MKIYKQKIKILQVIIKFAEQLKRTLKHFCLKYFFFNSISGYKTTNIWLNLDKFVAAANIAISQALHLSRFQLWLQMSRCLSRLTNKKGYFSVKKMPIFSSNLKMATLKNCLSAYSLLCPVYFFDMWPEQISIYIFFGTNAQFMKWKIRE